MRGIHGIRSRIDWKVTGAGVTCTKKTPESAQPFVLCRKVGSGRSPFTQSSMSLLSLNSQLWLLVALSYFQVN